MIYDYFAFSSGKYAELEEMYGGKLPWEFINFLEWMEKGASGENSYGYPCFLFSNPDGTVEELQCLLFDKSKKSRYKHMSTIKSEYDLLKDWDKDDRSIGGDGIEWISKNGFVPFAEAYGDPYILMNGKVYFVFHEEWEKPELVAKSMSDFIQRTRYKNIYDKLMKTLKLRPGQTIKVNGHDIQILDANKSERIMKDGDMINSQIIIAFIDGDPKDFIMPIGNSLIRQKIIGKTSYECEGYGDTIEDVLRLKLKKI